MKKVLKESALRINITYKKTIQKENSNCFQNIKLATFLMFW